MAAETEAKSRVYRNRICRLAFGRSLDQTHSAQRHFTIDSALVHVLHRLATVSVHQSRPQRTVWHSACTHWPQLQSVQSIEQPRQASASECSTLRRTAALPVVGTDEHQITS